MPDTGKLSKGLTLLKIEKKKSYPVLHISLIVAILISICYIMYHMIAVHGNKILPMPMALTILLGISYLFQELRPPTKLIFYMRIDEEKIEIWKSLFFTFDFISYNEEEKVITVTPTVESEKLLMKMMKDFDL